MASWVQKFIVTALTNPVAALFAAFYLVLWTGLVKVILDLVNQRNASIEANFRLFFSGTALLLFIVAVIAGAIAIVYRLRGRGRPVAPENESLQDRVWRLWTDPFTLLEAGIYGVMLLGLMATVVQMYQRRNAGALNIFEGWVLQLFYVLIGVLLLVALRAVVDSIGKAKAPSGGAEDEKKSDDTVAVAEKAQAEKPAASAVEPAPAWSQKLIEQLSTAPQQLKVGTYIVAYLGLTSLAIDVWDQRGFADFTIWTSFVWGLLTVVVATGLLILAARVVDVLQRRQHAEVSGDGGVAAFVQELLPWMTQPGKTAQAVLLVIASEAAVWVLMSVWNGRFSTVLNFWEGVTSTLFTAGSVVAIPLVLWSVWQALFTQPGA